VKKSRKSVSPPGTRGGDATRFFTYGDKRKEDRVLFWGSNRQNPIGGGGAPSQGGKKSFNKKKGERVVSEMKTKMEGNRP